MCTSERVQVYTASEGEAEGEGWTLYDGILPNSYLPANTESYEIGVRNRFTEQNKRTRFLWPRGQGHKVRRRSCWLVEHVRLHALRRSSVFAPLTPRDMPRTKTFLTKRAQPCVQLLRIEAGTVEQLIRNNGLALWGAREHQAARLDNVGRPRKKKRVEATPEPSQASKPRNDSDYIVGEVNDVPSSTSG